MAILLEQFTNRGIIDKLVLSDKIEDKKYKEDINKLQDLIGKEGIAYTMLRPAGSMFIGDIKYDVVTDGEFIPRGSVVKVIKVEGTKIFVRQK